MPVGRCSPKLARSAADEKHELLHAFDDDLGEHHEPRRERCAPQQGVYRLRHAIPPKITVSNTQKITEQNADHNQTHENPPAAGNLTLLDLVRLENFAHILGNRRNGRSTHAAGGRARPRLAAPRLPAMRILAAP
jgi:hypothetical protein